MRDRLAALEHAVERIAELERMRALRVCVLAPALEPGFRRAFLVSGGRVASLRTIPPGTAGKLEVAAALAEASLGALSFAPEDADALLLVSQFLRRPGPELRVVELDADAILAA